ncbi:winged helix DNA-binding domain-containing protein [Nocardia huaxiensis]|uniref:Winged helix DNA-binding domain-containing protein n=1 Tax=Nocardia huaxiensis TaxID=2755382 RepID=A0A7D6VB69_9NOCA|nr:winged helix DNA-binding domain-containing protein [Nocardia huaxiensis]QLY28015.1 winged helix DNA-binding domain-containing protein [Nocardia huaxiensis]
MRVTWDQVFAWRMRRQFVEPRAKADAVEIARRLCGVQSQVASAAETAVALRSSTGEPGAVAAALADRTLMKTWTMRGTLHALTPEQAAAGASLMGATRIWEKAAWTKNFGPTPAEMDALVEAVGEILDSAVLTRDELVTALVAEPRFKRLEDALRNSWGGLLKPLAWRGALCYGPSQGNTVTFTNPAHLIPAWPGIPDPDAAAPGFIADYLAAYGPATPEIFDAWLTRNNHRKTVVRRWFAELGDRLTEVDVEGRPGYILTDHADELAAIKPKPIVRLLGSFDQYVLGPGTGDAALLPSAHRPKVSRAAGWISPLVVVNGRIVGTWETSGEELTVTMFDNAPAPMAELEREAPHVARALGQSQLKVRTA